MRHFHCFKTLKRAKFFPILAAVLPGASFSECDSVPWNESARSRYLNRIRDFSSPEKIFIVFASSHKPFGARFMTLNDFVASFVPDLCPTAGAKRVLKNADYHPFFALIDADSDGLISEAEYVLLSAMLEIPENHIPAAFRMSDVNGDGVVDVNEFLRLAELLRAKSFTGLSLGREARGSHLLRRFFGDAFEETLSLDRFEAFLVALRETMHRMEFDVYDAGRRGEIDAARVVESVLVFCPRKKADAYRARLAAMPPEIAAQPVSREAFVLFNRALSALGEIKFALDTFEGKRWGAKSFQRAVCAAAGVTPPPELASALLFVFNGDSGASDLFEALSARYRLKRAPLADTSTGRRVRCLMKCLGEAN